MTFEQLNLSKPLLRAVETAGYSEPSPVQEKAIPPVLLGQDLLACAQTGTGKTAAFALPILQNLAKKHEGGVRKIRALVLTPTRELAMQIYESFKNYGRYTALRSTVIFGGVGQNPQVAMLRRGVDILVATPGRLNDLIGQGHIKLDGLEVFVLDEADRMLDMGFIHDIKKVIKLIPQKRQTLFFSATMPKEIASLSDSLLSNPTKIYVTPASSPVETVSQELYMVDKRNKTQLLVSLLENNSFSHTLVFTRTKHGADRLERDLNRKDIAALAIHGNKSQAARQTALEKFKRKMVRVLVATDIAARGIDISELPLVVNFDMPDTPETYVHRIGRTGRAGNSGVAISFCSADQKDNLKDIQKLIGFNLPVKESEWPLMDNSSTKGPAYSAGAKKTTDKTQRKPFSKQSGQKSSSQPQRGASAQQRNTSTTQKSVQTQNVAAPQKADAVQQNQQKRKNSPGNPAVQAKSPAPQRKSGGRTQQKPFKFNPYEQLKGAQAIINRRPVWSAGDEPAESTTQASANVPAKKGSDMQKSRPSNNPRPSTSTSKNRPARGPAAPAKQAQQRTPVAKEKPRENGLHSFSESELQEDKSIQVIRRTGEESKFTTFDDYLKNQK